MDADRREVHGRYSAAQLCRLLRMSPDRLRRWVRQGLVKPTEADDGPYFDFEQLTAVRTLWALTQAGVPLGQIRRGLDQLRSWLPSDGDEPLANLSVIERDGRILVRLEEGHLADPSGQMHLDFTDDADHPDVISSTEAPSADECWDRGIALEEQGMLAEAEEAFRDALHAGGPNAQLCFNLGNVLYAQGHKEQAAERFSQAVELDPAFAESWNNLGNALCDLEQLDRALAAYRLALKQAPQFADAHFNLAHALDSLGRRQDARPHWHMYLSLEPSGPWAEHARTRVS